MNESPIAPALDAAPFLMPVVPVLADIDAESAGTALPADHPSWQRDVVSMSTRARSIAAAMGPIVVRALSFWDHRLREILFGARTLAMDPSGCYRLR